MTSLLLSLHKLITNQQHVVKRLYRSGISVNKLYPNSSCQLSTPSLDEVKTPDGLKFNGVIPIDKLELKYSRSSGPGGQHVNTVNTKVDLRFKVEEADWLNDEVKQKLIEMNKNRLSKDGYLIIKSDRTRSQQLNLADAISTLRYMIWKAARPVPKPDEDTLDRIRLRQEIRTRERLIDKKFRSLTKAHRRDPGL